MGVNEKIESEITEALEALSKSYLNQDIDGIVKLLAPRADVIFVGAGKVEKWIGLDEIKQKVHETFTEPDPNASWEWTWKQISQRGKVVWTAADYTFKTKLEGKEVTILHRFTAVFEKYGGKWLIAEQHHSIPVNGHD